MADTAKHTPGPWKVVASGDGSFAIEDHSEVYIIAQRNAWPARIVESQANARLIAAAPELLEALRQMVAMNEADGTVYRDSHIAAVAAIAKAEGRS